MSCHRPPELLSAVGPVYDGPRPKVGHIDLT
jgi:hypothetical protein